MGLTWVCHGFAMGLPWVCHRFAMGLPWVCHGFAMGLPWVCHGLAMGLPSVCQGLAFGLPRICQGSAKYRSSRLTWLGLFWSAAAPPAMEVVALVGCWLEWDGLAALLPARIRGFLIGGFVEVPAAGPFMFTCRLAD